MYVVLYSFFFFKQKTAYEMRISDWSSDVCSSDLLLLHADPGRSARCRRALGHAGLAGLCAAAIAGVLSRPHGLCPVSPSAPGNNLGAEVMTTTLCTDSPSGKRYDLAVIGAGSAGFAISDERRVGKEGGRKGRSRG